jgi:DNA invertase Pin-like site-specific DNA recombinase
VSALKIGYARVSTDAQDLTAQRDALGALGIEPERIYVDHGFTGTHRDRPGLRQALAACRAGDELVVTKLDRLARSLPDARAIADELTSRQVKLNLGGSVHDPTDPVGRLLFNVLAMVAEFEADLIRARTRVQRDAGGAPRRALPRWPAHGQRARGAVLGHALDRLPGGPPRRRARARGGVRHGRVRSGHAERFALVARSP